MAVAPPRRRRSDARRPQPAPFAPTPGDVGPPDPLAVQRSIEGALDSARRLRRPLTLVALHVPGAGPTAERLLLRTADLARRTVRETDGVWRDGTLTLLILLADADGPTAEPALARIRLRLRREGVRGVAMGRATPAPGISAADLVSLAHANCRSVS